MLILYYHHLFNAKVGIFPTTKCILRTYTDSWMALETALQFLHYWRYHYQATAAGTTPYNRSTDKPDMPNSLLDFHGLMHK